MSDLQEAQQQLDEKQRELDAAQAEYETAMREKQVFLFYSKIYGQAVNASS